LRKPRDHGPRLRFQFGVPAQPPQLTQVAILFDELRTKSSVLIEKTYRIIESVASLAAGKRSALNLRRDRGYIIVTPCSSEAWFSKRIDVINVNLIGCQRK
jgi:hypothetical protein